MLVLGAGDVGEGTAVALAGAGVAEVVVANRTGARAHALARRVRGRAIPLDDVADAMVATDVLLCTTCASDVVLERGDVEQVMARRDGRALLIVDVAVPRDVDPGVRQVFGVTVLDIDDLKAFAEQSLEQRRREVTKVRRIVAEELERLQIERSAREVAPVITAMRERADSIRAAELERFAGPARVAHRRATGCGRRAHRGDPEQAAARADRPPEGRRGNRPAGAVRRRARRPVRSPGARRPAHSMTRTLTQRALRVAPGAARSPGRRPIG